MKRLLSILICALLLCGCAQKRTSSGDILISILEGPGFTVLDNGQRVSPGEDVSFHLRLESGFSITDTSFDGEYSIQSSGRDAVVTVHGVQYPSRIQLTLSSKYCSITYDANGGTAVTTDGVRYSKNYDLSYHRRPNTELGTDRFSRDGYTLIAWNTQPDGSGVQVGLGSRITPDSSGSLTLYAQWLPWTSAELFSYEPCDGGIRITGCTSDAKQIVIPGMIDGTPVVTLSTGSFSGLPVESLVLPATMQNVEPGAIDNCSLHTLTLFDNIRSIRDDAISGCPDFTTLHINALEYPYGYIYRRESCYADKIDLLILAQGKKKMVCYGGCSMWFNMDGPTAVRELGEEYTLINLGLNGTVSSLVQLQILTPYLEQGDLFFHTPELSSRAQLLIDTDMGPEDPTLWCGLENNYDLFASVDLKTVHGALDSLCSYLEKKSGRSSYTQRFTDDKELEYMDARGCIPFFRGKTVADLSKTDRVFLSDRFISPTAMERLEACYQAIQARGAAVCLSYACVNMDALPAGQENNVEMMDTLFREAIEEMDGVYLVSSLVDYLYHNEDFYDTNYHLLTIPAQENTQRWLRDLRAWMEGNSQ